LGSIVYQHLAILFHYFSLFTTLLPTEAESLLFSCSANLYSLFFLFSSSSSLLVAVAPAPVPNLIALSYLLASYSDLDS